MAVRKKTGSAAKVKPCKEGDLLLHEDCYQLYLVAAIKKGADCSNRIVVDLGDNLAKHLTAKLRKKAASSRKRK
jgi:hypothetical protein